MNALSQFVRELFGIAVQEIISAAAVKIVGFTSTVEFVIVDAPIKVIGSGSAEQKIIPQTAIKVIVSVIAGELIVAAIAVQRVIAGVAEYRLREDAADKGLIAGRALDLGDVGHRNDRREINRALEEDIAGSAAGVVERLDAVE